MTHLFHLFLTDLKKADLISLNCFMYTCWAISPLLSIDFDDFFLPQKDLCRVGREELVLFSEFILFEYTGEFLDQSYCRVHLHLIIVMKSIFTEIHYSDTYTNPEKKGLTKLLLFYVVSSHLLRDQKILKLILMT